jgi:hypothetical protein
MQIINSLSSFFKTNKQHNVVDADNLIKQIYQNINGFSISQSSQHRKQYKKDQESSDPFTYREIHPNTLIAILDNMEVPKGCFYDLGSGVGKQVVIAAIYNKFTACIGVELLPELHQAAEIAKYKSKYILSKRIYEKICFHNQDILDYEIAKPAVVFMYSTCFSNNMLQLLAVKLSCMPRGTKIISVTKKLLADNIKLNSSQQYEMSWGQATVHIQEVC